MHTLLSITKEPYSSATIKISDIVTSALESEVTLFTVTSKQSSDQATLDELQLVSEQMSSPSNILVRQGNPATEILSELNSGKYNLLAICARAHSSAPN